MDTVGIFRTDLGASAPQGMQDSLDLLRARVAEQDAIIDGLSATAQNMQRDLDAAAQRHEQSVSRHRADIAVIGERLLEEAQDRDWCGEYDTVIDALNKQLTVELPLRERDHEVEVDIRVSVRVEARDAEETAESEPYRDWPPLGSVAEPRLQATVQRDQQIIRAMQRRSDRNPIRSFLWRRPWRSPGRAPLRGFWQWLRNAHDCADPAVGCSCRGGFRYPDPPAGHGAA